MISINTKTGQKLKHKDKIEWIDQIILRHNIKQTKWGRHQYFSHYNTGWPAYETGWKVTYAMLFCYDCESIIDVIKHFDKIFGFVDFVEPSQQELQLDTNWYEEDMIYSRDMRRSQSKK